MSYDNISAELSNIGYFGFVFVIPNCLFKTQESVAKTNEEMWLKVSVFTCSANITIFSYGTLPALELCFCGWVNKILLISYDIKAFNTYTSPSFDTHKLSSCGKLLSSLVFSFVVYLLHLESMYST